MTENQTTLTPLQKAFLAIEKLQAKLACSEQAMHEPIALIGMACRFPGKADNLTDYWELLENGVDAVGPIPKRRWDHQAFYDANGTTPGTTYVREAAFLDAASDPSVGFDAEFFGIPPKEANLLDPQQRLLLELAYEALEHAGIPSRSLKDSNTGVFIGIGQQDYLHLIRETAMVDGAELYMGTGNGFCFASGRLSYSLGLQGPSFSLDTACSSSLVAVHQACLSLRAKECDLALTGGVQLMLSPSAFVLMSGSKALARDGRCKPFDAAADGYGRGEGGGMVALKRLSDAINDEDRILAVIRGSSVDHDGRSSGLTVPNGRAQQILLRRALSVAGMVPEAVGYVEAHGTGTSLGDPIEFQALADVLRHQSATPLLLGSVKSNIGHLEAAAGIAGLIKLVMAIQQARIPPALHFKQPNPAIPWQDYPIRVVTTMSDWPDRDNRVGLVSSFGLSGTNSQVIIGQSPEIACNNVCNETSQLFKLSAKTPAALRDWAGRHWQKLARAEDESLADICYSANASRDDYDWRLATVVSSVSGLRAFLETAMADANVLPIAKKTKAPVFLFSGQGSVQTQAGHALFQTQPVFKAALLACDDALTAQGHASATELLYGEQSAVLLQHTAHEQVALFALQYALAKMWLSWGIVPGMVLGHSVGEYAAACIAGVFDVATAINLLCARGRLMQALPDDGGMVAVFAGADSVRPLLQGLDDKLAIAAVNAQDQVVVSGTRDALLIFCERALQNKLTITTLPVRRGFHSPQVDAMLPAFKDYLTGVIFNKPQLRFVSTVTGNIESAALTTVDYWLQHTRHSVLFAKAVDTAIALDGMVFIELGAKPVLAALCRNAQVTALSALTTAASDWDSIQRTLAALYQQGSTVDWAAFYQGRRKRLTALPTYPWQRQRYGFQPAPAGRKHTGQVSVQPIHPLLEQHTQSPLLNAILFQGGISCARLPFLDDHKVFGRVVVAGACHLSAAVAAARSVLGTGTVKLEHIEFIEALSLADHEQRALHLSLTPTAAGAYALKTISLPLTADQHATAFVENSLALIAPSAMMPALSLDSIGGLKQQCPESLAVADFYHLLAQQHVELGGSFRWLLSLHKGKQQALARMRAASADERAFGLHPGLIDACFQLLGAAVPEQYTATYIPVAVSQWQVNAPVQHGELWCHACLDQDMLGAEGLISGDVELFADDGAVVARFSGVSLRKADTGALQSALTVEQNLYTTEWQPAMPSAGVTVSYSRWLTVGQDLARQAAAGAVGTEWLDTGSFLSRHSLPVDGVLLCFDAGTGDWADSAQANTACLLACLQHWARVAPPDAPRLAVVTQQARAVNGNEAGDPGVALLAGLIRSFNHEYPAAHCQWLDIDSAALSAAEICQHLHALPDETEIALRDNRLYVSRLQRLSAADIKPQHWRGCYLVTGGSGALGLQTAEWLVGKGITEIVLMSRKAMTGTAQSQVDALKAQGVIVHNVYGDVADAGFVKAVLERFAGVLRGIIHAAGVLDDAVIANLKTEQVARVLRPKTVGLWNLHQHSLALTLDHFIVYSSVAALFGAPGQGNYAAANSFLDAFVAWRHQQGLPGLSLNWGPWAGSGMAAVQNTDTLAASGIHKLGAAQAFLLLEKALHHQQAQIGVFAIDWAQFALTRSAGWAGFFARQHPSQQARQNSAAMPAAAGLTTALAALATQQREHYLRAFLSEQVADVLGMTAGGRFAADQGFAELGMDSLMSLELKNRLQQALGTHLPSTLVFKYPSVDDLFAFLVAGALQPLFATPSQAQADDDDIALLLEQELSQLEEAHKR
ncbi:MAG: type I polyketide synthase [Aquabacterium sp.]|uniref:type I polyketide synthase n=1 Tax=Aquabacterium sp. TaxID=1872578 RepID=UPI00271CE804|nr:type I polyketide synthase [Aquabacterium sp.]MDO9003894.1 type I polyketide synthase [Aquabacterium sp.]